MKDLKDPAYTTLLKKIKETPAFREFANDLAIELITEGKLETLYTEDYLEMICQNIFDDLESLNFSKSEWADIYGYEVDRLN
jgi:hypothetical protein